MIVIQVELKHCAIALGTTARPTAACALRNGLVRIALIVRRATLVRTATNHAQIVDSIPRARQDQRA